MKNQELDKLVFRLEKLFLTAESYDNIVNPSDYSLPFYALLDEIRDVEKVYEGLATPLRDLI